MLTDAFPNRITPNIRGNILSGFRRAKDVVVETHLPEPLAGSLTKIVTRPEFKIADELAKIGVALGALRKNMDMIRHQAVRMNNKIMARGRVEKLPADPRAKISVR